jgi:hypothetical protein
MAGPTDRGTAALGARNLHGIALCRGLWAALLATGMSPGLARADDPPPEQLLRERGLVRSGAVYIFKGEDHLRDRVAEIDRLAGEWNRAAIGLELELETLGPLHARYEDQLRKLRGFDAPRRGPGEPMQEGFPGDAPPPEFRPPPPDSRPSPGRDPPPSDGPAGFDSGAGEGFLRLLRPGETRRAASTVRLERAALEAEIAVKQVHCDDLVALLQAKLGDIERRQLEVVRLDSEIRPRYAALADDSRIQQALETLNADGNAMLMLGPSQDYRKAATETVQALQENLRQLTKRLAGLALTGTNRFAGLLGAGEALLQDLAILTGRQQSLEREATSRKNMLAEQAKRQENFTRELASATDPARKDRIAADLRALETRDQTLRAERAGLRDSIAEATATLESTRADFLRMVRAIRDAIRAADQELASSEAEPGAPPAGKRAPRGDRGPRQAIVTEPFKQRLRELEKTIRAERVPLDVDKSIHWVDVAINSGPPRKMVVDPANNEVRLSARFAAGAGIRPAPADPTVASKTLDGRTITGRRMSIEALALGPFVLHDVECVVLPASAGDMPSALGNRVLGQFSTAIDAGAATLVLTHVQVKPISHSGKGPAARLSGLSHGKKPPVSTDRPQAGRSSQGSAR